MNCICKSCIKKDGQIQELKQYIKELKENSYLDPLTQVYNREFLKKVQSNLFYGVVMIDIDYFKKINDSHGHQVGDKVLKSVAQTLKENSRSSDFVIRFGGEEFLVLLKDVRLTNNIEKIANRYREVIEKLRIQESNLLEISVTISSGIALFYNDLEQTIKKADKALYKAKKSGRNIVCSTL